eukprot:2820447-Rhodomonas_salina.2
MCIQRVYFARAGERRSSHTRLGTKRAASPETGHEPTACRRATGEGMLTKGTDCLSSCRRVKNTAASAYAAALAGCSRNMPAR